MNKVDTLEKPEKSAETRYAIHDILRQRWSPRAFSNETVAPEDLMRLLEAARWAPSGGNSQPWAFIVGLRGDETHTHLVEATTGRNPIWAKDAPILVLAVARTERQPGVANPFAFYDVGQAVAHLSIQAHAMGLHVHQMGGYDAAKVRQAFALPEGYAPVTITAIGYQGELSQLPDDLRERELQVRTRKPLSEFVFNGAWDQPLNIEAGNTVDQQ